MARADKKCIDPSIKLPCDFIAGHMRFRKGIKLETVRKASERWLMEAMKAAQPDPEKLRKAIAELRQHQGEQ